MILLTQPVPEGDYGVWAIPDKLTLCLPTMVLFSLAVAQDGWDLSVSILVGDALGHSRARDVGDLRRGIAECNPEDRACLWRRRCHGQLETPVAMSEKCLTLDEEKIILFTFEGKFCKFTSKADIFEISGFIM